MEVRCGPVGPRDALSETSNTVEMAVQVPCRAVPGRRPGDRSANNTDVTQLNALRDTFPITPRSQV